MALTALTVAALLGTAACGGGSDDAADGDEIASLDDGSTDATTDATTEGTAAPEDMAEALLAFTECMRENGVDMPDPQVGEGGQIAIAVQEGPDSDVDMEAAQKECEPLMANARGDMVRDPEQEAEMQAQMLEFAQCMREHGIDMPDPQFDGDGSVRIGGGPGAEGDSQAFQEAQEACAPDGMVMAAPTQGGGDDGVDIETDEDG